MKIKDLSGWIGPKVKNLDKILEEIHFSKNFSHAHFFIDPLGDTQGKNCTQVQHQRNSANILLATANPETAATANKDLNCIARDETERKLRKKRKKKKKERIRQR